MVAQIGTHTQEASDGFRNMNQSTARARRSPRRQEDTSRINEYTIEGGHSDLCEQVSAAVRDLNAQVSHSNLESGMQEASSSSRSMSRSTRRTSRISQGQDTQSNGYSNLCDKVSAVVRDMNKQSGMVNGDFSTSESDGMHEASGRARDMNRSTERTRRISRERSNTSRTTNEHLTGAGHSDLCERISAVVRKIDS